MSLILGTDTSGKIEFRQLTKERLDEAIALQTETMQRECIAIGVGISEEPGAEKEIQAMFRNVAEYGVSIIGIDIDTNQVVAVCFNKIHVRPTNGEGGVESLIENADHETCQELINFVHSVESGVNIFERYNVNVAMELAYLGTDPRYQGRGIGYRIAKATVDLAKGLLQGKFKKNPLSDKIILEDLVPECIFGVFASDYSQRIATKLSFEPLTTVSYENYLSRGKKMSDRIGDTHKTAKLAALKL